MGQSIILGFGFRSAATVQSFVDAVRQTKLELSYDGIAVPDDKKDHPMLQAFARQQSLPIFGISQAVIAAIETPSQSEMIKQKRQTGSVAEAAAMAVLKNPIEFLATRCISQDRLAVVAIAKGELS